LITITSCHPTVTDCPGRNQPAASSSAQVVVPSQPSLLPSSSSSLQLSLSSSRLGPTSCPQQRWNADNCLRALERGQAQQFCHSFTQRVVTDTAGLPSYTTQCTGSTISRVSSACSCLNSNSGSAQPTFTSPGSATSMPPWPMHSQPGSSQKPIQTLYGSHIGKTWITLVSGIKHLTTVKLQTI
jgi:hypothetical protein